METLTKTERAELVRELSDLNKSRLVPGTGSYEDAQILEKIDAIEDRLSEATVVDLRDEYSFLRDAEAVAENLRQTGRNFVPKRIPFPGEKWILAEATDPDHRERLSVCEMYHVQYLVRSTANSSGVIDTAESVVDLLAGLHPRDARSALVCLMDEIYSIAVRDQEAKRPAPAVPADQAPEVLPTEISELAAGGVELLGSVGIDYAPWIKSLLVRLGRIYKLALDQETASRDLYSEFNGPRNQAEEAPSGDGEARTAPETDEGTDKAPDASPAVYRISDLDRLIAEGEAVVVAYPVASDINHRVVKLSDGSKWRHVDGGWLGKDDEATRISKGA